MKLTIKFAIVVAMLAILSRPLAASANPPALPYIIYGPVTIRDNPAPVGTLITAYVSSVAVAQTTVQNSAGQSVFMVAIPGGEALNQPDIGQSQNTRVRFRVGDTWAPQTSQWSSGAVAQIALHVYPNRWLPLTVKP